MDETSFERLFREQFPDVWRYARRRADSRETAEEVTAATFAIAWRRRAKIPPGDETRLWLFGVARNVLNNEQRGQRRRRQLFDRLSTISPASATGTPADDGLAPGDGPAIEALASLRATDRDLIAMQAWDDLSIAEIAVVLGCSRNAASIRLHKARRRLAERLENHPAGTQSCSDRTPPDTKEAST